MQAPGEKFVPGVDGCLLRLVHQDVFFLQAQAAGVVACLEGGAVGEDPPLDVDVIMEDALFLEGPDVASQLGVFPLLGVLEVGLVVPVPPVPVLCYINIYIYIMLYSYNICNIIFSTKNISFKGETFYLGLH